MGTYQLRCRLARLGPHEANDTLAPALWARILGDMFDSSVREPENAARAEG